METINDVCSAVTSGKSSLGFTKPVLKSCRQWCIPRIPPIVPVSYLQELAKCQLMVKDESAYPKRTPPKATNNPTKMAGMADPAEPSGFFNMRPMLANSSNDNRQGEKEDLWSGRRG
jgi:hypothetical protein